MSVVQPAAYYDSVYTTGMTGQSFEWMEETANAVEPHIIGSALDLGCGLGYIAQHVSDRYVGVDFSVHAIEQAREACSNQFAKFVVCDIERLPVDWGRFDTVLLMEVLEHVFDPPKIFEIAMRYSRRRIIVTVPRSMAGRAHVWPVWTKANLEHVCGNLAVCELFGGPHNDRWWLAVKNIK